MQILELQWNICI